MAYKKIKKKCPNCHTSFMGHPNARFCKQRCKDAFHNRENPRGYGLTYGFGTQREGDPDDDEHPFSSEALGQH